MLWVLAASILMSTHNIGFYEKITKIIVQLSSNTHLISSSVKRIFSPSFYQHGVIDAMLSLMFNRTIEQYGDVI